MRYLSVSFMNSLWFIKFFETQVTGYSSIPANIDSSSIFSFFRLRGEWASCHKSDSASNRWHYRLIRPKSTWWNPKNPQDVISVQPHSYFGTSLFGTTMSHWYKNVFCGHTILDYRKIDKFKLSIRKVPKTSDYRFLADYSDNQLAKSLKRFEIRWVTWTFGI